MLISPPSCRTPSSDSISAPPPPRPSPGTPDGRPVAEGRAPLSLERPEPNAYEQHPDAWWRAVQTALAGVTAQIPADSVAAVAVVNQRETIAVTDADDRPLRPAILWLDERRKAEVAALSAKVGVERMHALTGKPLDFAPAVYSLAWLARAEPDVFARIAHVYDPHAWIVRQLTGEFATSWASADPLGAFDIGAHVWADDVLQALPLATEKFPRASAPGTVIGQVTPAAAALTGLRAGTPVVSGGGDGQAGGLGTGVAKPGTAYLNLGTAVVSGVYDREPRIDPAFRTMCAIDRDGYILETSLRSGTLLVNSMIRQVFGLDPDADPGIFRRLEQEAAAVRPGSGGLLLLPYWNGVMNPYWDQDARGCLLGCRPTMAGERSTARCWKASRWSRPSPPTGSQPRPVLRSKASSPSAAVRPAIRGAASWPTSPPAPSSAPKRRKRRAWEPA